MAYKVTGSAEAAKMDAREDDETQRGTRMQSK